MPLFEPGLKYPRDRVGEYVDVIGEVVLFEEDGCVTISTSYGNIRGWTDEDGPITRYAMQNPGVLKYAHIRVYNAGGGWYPDNKLIAISRDRESLPPAG